MTKQHITTPFGLLFEESASPAPQVWSPIYDDALDLSFVEQSPGQRVPFIELERVLGTETATKAEGENQEIQDIDPQDRLTTALVATETITAVEAEEDDRDVDDRIAYAVLSTETITRVEGETTDADESIPPNQESEWLSLSRTNKTIQLTT